MSDFRQSEQWQKAQRGELYLAFVPELIKARERCAVALEEFNTTKDTSRRNMVRLFREITMDPRPLPPPRPSASSSTSTSTSKDDDNNSNNNSNNKDNKDDKGEKEKEEEEDSDETFNQDPHIMRPLHADYGVNLHISPGAFVNFKSTFVDTCPIVIGARTLVGPGCSFYAGTHPLDPAVRNGTEGPETGKPIVVGEDCWLGGNVVVLCGVTIGRGCTIGAGSVVTKSIPPFHLAVGNPARIVRKIESEWDK